MPRGGSRKGAGRPQKGAKISKTFRLSPQLADWLEGQANQTDLVEKALHSAAANQSDGICPICGKGFEDCEYFRQLDKE